jgi:NADP-dependent aldehyde dehydrogenase
MIHGKNQLGFELSAKGKTTIQAVKQADLSFLSGNFVPATSDEVELAMDKAVSAFKIYSKISAEKRAQFLDTIANEILNLGNELVQRTMAETGLPEGRIVGERGRTMNQLRLFATVLREGSWVNASIDTAIPDREPAPKPDIRKMNIPMGPVAIFTASNFPLAFSTAGGDTASALASGCPVIIKAHESHLGTNELVTGAIIKAAKKCSIPDGVFSSLNASGFEVGQQLVTHPKTEVVTFTGSFKGGKALYDLAQKREKPIPVFAEMGSVNPLVILPDALKNNSENLGKQLAGSITLGVGQFCTNPGLIICIDGNGLNTFTSTLTSELSAVPKGTMLNKGIQKNYEKLVNKSLSEDGIVSLNEWDKGSATLAVKVDASDFIKNPKLHEEVFGPFSMVVICKNKSELEQTVGVLEGQLTASIMHDGEDLVNFQKIANQLSTKVGRLIYNGVPTGVEVCYSMQHGGPFPATTDSRFTSVGTDAIKRFVRPLSIQDAPHKMLPDELKNENPLQIWRKINGELTKNKI